MSATTTATTAMRALAAAIRANVPALLWGMPGTAKTAILTSYGEAWGRHVETISGSIREPSDFLGLPIESDGRVIYSPPAWARRLAEAPAGLLFLDELTTAAPSVQKAMLRILQEREVGELSLPSSVAIVAAANPPSVAVDGWDLAAPVANRLCHIDWHLDAEAWLSGLVTGFGSAPLATPDEMIGRRSPGRRARVVGSVAAFLHRQPNLVVGVPTDPALAGRGWPSPRSWTNAVAVLAELPDSDEDAALVVLTGCVGEGAATEYLAWLAASDLYDPEAVLADPRIVDWSQRPDRIYALVSSVVALAVSDGAKRRWEQGIAVLTACAEAGRPDMAYPGASTLLASIPQGAKVPQRTAQAFADLMSRIGRWAA